MKVQVASGEELSSPGICAQTQILIQGIPIAVDLYILPLEGYDIVLGTQWLRTLGPIVWDFEKLLMAFNLGKEQVIFQGCATPPNRLVSAFQMQQLTKLLNRGFLLQIMEPVYATQQIPTIHPQIKTLLDKYNTLLTEPTGLPPQRLHDHKIPLKNPEPISVRPYRYPFYQKTEIE